MYLPDAKILTTKIKEVHVGNGFVGGVRVVVLDECVSSTETAGV